MKKFLTVLLALLLLCGSCLAEGLDYASMTDAQLHDIVDAARNELTKRELVAEGKTLLFEQDGRDRRMDPQIFFGLSDRRLQG